jgi:hypothetical protein
MAHFAKVENGIVTKVIVAEPEFFDTFVDDSPGEWVQTSYNTRLGIHYTVLEDGSAVESEDQSKALRKNYAGIGYTYDKDLDAFYKPQPYPSWVLNQETCGWEAPTPKPLGDYKWDEDTTSWVEVTPET